MIKHTILAAVLVVAGTFSIVSSAVAQADNPVVIRVNGYEIRALEVRLAVEGLAAQLAEMPAQTRYPFAVQYLVERHLLAQEAMRQKIDQDAEFKRLMAYYQAKAARDAYFLTKIKTQVTEQDARAEYDKQVAAVNNQEKFRLRHILVENEVAAKTVHGKLKGGADFAQLANENTAGAGSRNGGDLGWFTEAEMSPHILKATKGLNAGEFSPPYETDEGWYIIKIDEKSVVNVQPFDKIKNGLIALLVRRKVQELANALTAKAEIEVVDPDLKKLQEQKKAE